MLKLTKPSRSRFYGLLCLSCLAAGLLSACNDLKSPAPLHPQTLTFRQRGEWRALLGWHDGCEQAYQSTKGTDDLGVEVYALGKEDLVRVLCAVGSYQPSFLLYMLKDGKPNLLQLETYAASEGGHLQLIAQTELWGEISVDTKTHVLTLVNVARQTKDCGTWAEYSLTADAVPLQTLYGKLPCVAKIGDPVSPDATAPPKDWTRLNNQAQ